MDSNKNPLRSPRFAEASCMPAPGCLISGLDSVGFSLQVTLAAVQRKPWAARACPLPDRCPTHQSSSARPSPEAKPRWPSETAVFRGGGRARRCGRLEGASDTVVGGGKGRNLLCDQWISTPLQRYMIGFSVSLPLHDIQQIRCDDVLQTAMLLGD